MEPWSNRYKSMEVSIGFWAKRKTKYGFKLVKSDRSPTIGGHNVDQSIGKRSDKPTKHRARTRW